MCNPTISIWLSAEESTHSMLRSLESTENDGRSYSDVMERSFIRQVSFPRSARFSTGSNP